MQVEQIDTIYARALLGAADAAGPATLPGGVLSDVADEVAALRKIFAAEPDFELFVESPRLENSTKREVLERALRGKVSDILVNFLLLLLDKSRERHLAGILAEFGRLHDEHIGLVRAAITSASALGDELVGNLRDRMAAKLGKRVEITADVDPDILGGLVVRYEGMVADGSLKTALDDMRADMLALKFGSEMVHEDQS